MSQLEKQKKKLKEWGEGWRGCSLGKSMVYLKMLFKNLGFKDLVFVILSFFFVNNFFPRIYNQLHSAVGTVLEVSKNLLCACFFEILWEIFNCDGRG